MLLGGCWLGLTVRGVRLRRDALRLTLFEKRFESNQTVVAKAGPAQGLVHGVDASFGTEVPPVAIVDDHDGHLLDADGADHEVERFGVMLGVEDAVLDLLAVDDFLRTVTVSAVVLCENRDCHVCFLLRYALVYSTRDCSVVE